MGNYLSEDAQKILNIADQAGSILLKHFKTVLEIDYKKDEFDPVTLADRESDNFIREQLYTLYPNDLILSEENDDVPKEYIGRVWMVDPLNGTKSFVKGSGTFAVVIGLVVNGVPILGCVNVPAQNKVFCAEKGKGAFEKVSGAFEKIHTSSVHEIQESCLITREQSNEVRPIEEKLNQLPFLKRVEGISGAKVCMIARGDAEVHINTNFRACKWDTAAPQIILEEAGGVVSDLDGQPINYKKESVDLDRSYVASANMELHLKIIEELRKLNV
ncbi:MAG: 3'(2'),5'-bisphosphate nucleotidase CysQ [Candidatus Pacebacteria bacterium]|nr:3'(2'),5'-bisphosphate nucleotidase CysQ [Candidatus Paceibacterota bacterium]